MSAPADAVPVATAQANAPAEIKAVVGYLRGKNGPKIRRGVLNGKRVDYFRGRNAVKALLLPAYKKVKKAPKVETAEEAEALLARMLPHAFFLRTERPENPPTPAGTPKPLTMSPTQSFSGDAYYTWFTAASPLSTILGGLAMVLVMLAGVMFPLWPPVLRLGVYYLSLGVLGLIGVFIGIAIVRLVLWMATSLVLKRGIWWFPKLFDDVGFVESFIPFWAWDEPPPKKGKKGPKTRKAKAGVAAGEAVPVPVPAGPGPDDATPAAADVPAGVSGTERPGQGAPRDAALETGGEGSMRRRMQAYVEDAGDDE